MEQEIRQLKEAIDALPDAGAERIYSESGEPGPLLGILLPALRMLSRECSPAYLNKWEEESGFTFGLFLEEIAGIFQEQAPFLAALQPVLSSDFVLEDTREQLQRHLADSKAAGTRLIEIRGLVREAAAAEEKARNQLQELADSEARLRTLQEQKAAMSDRIAMLEELREEVNAGLLDRLEQEYNALREECEPLEKRRDELRELQESTQTDMRKAEEETRELLAQNAVMDENNALLDATMQRLRNRNEQIRESLQDAAGALLVQTGENTRLAEQLREQNGTFPELIRKARQHQIALEKLLKQIAIGQNRS